MSATAVVLVRNASARWRAVADRLTCPPTALTTERALVRVRVRVSGFVRWCMTTVHLAWSAATERNRTTRRAPSASASPLPLKPVRSTGRANKRHHRAAWHFFFSHPSPLPFRVRHSLATTKPCVCAAEKGSLALRSGAPVVSSRLSPMHASSRYSTVISVPGIDASALALHRKRPHAGHIVIRPDIWEEH